MIASKNLTPRNINSGLTLIELMIVMALIAILATAIWGNFFTSLTKGRDSRRKQDLDAISKSIELYYNDNKSYPLPTLIQWGSPFTHPSNSAVVYMQKLPNDPTSPSASYCYYSDGSYYKIYSNLENTNDSKIIPTVACPPSSSKYYNYGISSPNTTP
ncbi:prepilin-type N-terminal cleavage/methylation domain-containing protein [Candidatus Gottesmanbacteria bacterium]|nr:prepilin-type N-terminal cleavage/methylation domain-containing protein [Candidatus Gottesmanbacteria bacterium]